jgi:DNA-binding NarL/FixJ family response regulator
VTLSMPSVYQGPVRVLVVDDDDLLREALCEMLNDQGFLVVGRAASGHEGVELTMAYRPDVVLIDFRMPGMDGFEATSRIKAELPMTQSVVFTAYDDRTLTSEATRAGVYCLLVKGCRPQLVVDMLRQAAMRKWEQETAPTLDPC